jgi:hypothetical protein
MDIFDVEFLMHSLHVGGASTPLTCAVEGNVTSSGKSRKLLKLM